MATEPARDGRSPTPHFLACLKWVDMRPEIDPLTGEVASDHRFSGPSPSDLSALEWALRLADEAGGSVTVATSGPPEADTMLRDALAAGASRAVRITGTNDEASRTVASRLAAVASNADLVCCGVYSLDRGTGSVPAFLANVLTLPQALGLVSIGRDGERLVAERRLDHGRRERLAVSGRAVVSFEAGPELRRAPLAAALAARTATIEVIEASRLPDGPHGPGGPVAAPTITNSGPYRPRSKVKPAPEGDTRQRLHALLGNDAQQGAAQIHELEPIEAADLVVEQLQAWGYIEPAINHDEN